MAVRLCQDSWCLSTSDNVSVSQAVRFCSRNIPYLSGRVLVQTSLRYLNDKDAIMKQCHFYASRFEEAGVSRDRFAIKLPFSGAAATAAYKLNAKGMRTLQLQFSPWNKPLQPASRTVYSLAPTTMVSGVVIADPRQSCVYESDHDCRDRSTSRPIIASQRPRPCPRGMIMKCNHSSSNALTTYSASDVSPCDTYLEDLCRSVCGNRKRAAHHGHRQVRGHRMSVFGFF